MLRFKKFKQIFKRRSSVISDVRANHLTYLEEDALNELQAAVHQVERAGLKGIFIEAGCALGGSSIVITASKSKNRPFYIYDVFGQIPPPSEKDGEDVYQRYEIIKQGKSHGIGGNEYYGYHKNLLNIVINNFDRFGFPIDENSIELVKGLYQEKMVISKTVAFAHIDCDWYDSVMTCLQRIVPKLTRGGILIIDDYYCWSGCRKAVDQFFANKKSDFTFLEKSRLHIIRNSLAF